MVYGRAATTEIDLATDTQGFRIDGAGEGDRAGYSVASGDVNGDGRRDFVLGAIGTACRNGGLPKTCEGDAGAAYVVFGKATPANVDLANLGDGGFRMNGAAGDSKAGWAVAAGDFTGDGKDDVAVSAIWANNYSGATYVVKGKTSGTAVALGALGADGYRIDGDAEDQSGWSLASGDVDGDRKPELVIGVPFHGPDGSLMAGSAYVLKGGALRERHRARRRCAPATTASTAARRRTAPAGRWRPRPTSTATASATSCSAPRAWTARPGPTLAPAPNSVGPQESIGAAYVVYGSKTPANVNVGTHRPARASCSMGGGGFRWGDQAGWNVAGLGDIAGNGVNVAAVGIPGWDSNQQTPVGTGRDRGLALLLNGVIDPIAPTIADHLAARRRAHPARHADANLARSPAATTTRRTPARRPIAANVDRQRRRRCRRPSTDVGPHTVTGHRHVTRCRQQTIKSVTYNVVATASTAAPSGHRPGGAARSRSAPRGDASARSSRASPGTYTANDAAAHGASPPPATRRCRSPIRPNATGHLVNGAFALAASRSTSVRSSARRTEGRLAGPAFSSDAPSAHLRATRGIADR